MAKEIRWTPESIDAFNAVIKYLQKEWSDKEIRKFVQATDRVLNFIAKNPRMFRKTNKRNIHEALITPHNLLIYKIYATRIVLITFWDTRRNPRKKK
jgi:plasmid stabilization system protein ParE